MKASIRAEHLSAGYYGKPVLHDVSFSIEKEGIYVVLGQNGAGKTTLFRTIAGVLKPIVGSVRMETDGRESPPGDITYLAHTEGIPDGMKVSQALNFYSEVLGCSDEDVTRVVGYLGISDLMNKWFNPLSEGQRKKVALARSLLRRTAINIFDEPTANLDPVMAKSIRAYVKELSRESIVLYSSHNLYEANDIGDFVMLIRGGRVVALDEIGNLSTGKLEIEIRAEGDVQTLIDCRSEDGVYRLTVDDQREIPGIVERLVSGGIRIMEVKQIGNPLEELYTEMEK